MEDELDLDVQVQQEHINKADKRIERLSEKVKTIAQERDELAKSKAEFEAKAAEAQRERDFYAGFTDSLAKFPQAAEHKDAIRDKVLSGYSIEDATVAVLHSSGKLSPASAPHVEVESPLGGSAATALPGTGQKTVQEMSQTERLQALSDPSLQGDLERILRGGL